MDIFKEVREKLVERCLKLQDVLRIVRLMSIYPCCMIPINFPSTDIISHFIRFFPLPVE